MACFSTVFGNNCEIILGIGKEYRFTSNFTLPRPFTARKSVKRLKSSDFFYTSKARGSAIIILEYEMKWYLILCTQETEQPIVVKERICFDHLHIYVITFEFELKSVSHDTDIKSYLFGLSFPPIKQSFRTIIALETSNIARHDHKLCLFKNNRPDNRCLFKNNTQLDHRRQETGNFPIIL